MKTKSSGVLVTPAASRLLFFFFVMSLALHAQVSYTFSNCTATGLNGPTQGLVNTAYQATNLNGLVTVVGTGIQQWVVPTSGNYLIEAHGAQGGDNVTLSGLGGKGAYISGEFNLTAGTVLNIIVGQRGTNNVGGNANNGAGGGGGGSFVYVQAAPLPLIVAGGGGASCLINNGIPNYYGKDASTTTTGTGSRSHDNFANSPGGSGGANGTSVCGSGGKGWNTVMTNPAGNPSGNATYGADGGFGGGGGGGTSPNSGNSLHTGGGGGGYSGGGAGGSDYYHGGGGGGSYNTGINQTNAITTRVDHGMVVITRLCNVDLQASKNPLCNGESITLTTNAASNIVWSHNGSNASQVNVSPTANTTYTVTGQAISGCTTSVILTVSVNPLPNLTAVVSPSVLCVGKDATITASGANTYTWTTLSLNGPVATVNPPATTGYNVSGTNQFGCVNSAVINVNVNTNQLGISSNTSVCQGSSVQLSLSNAVTYTWSTGNNFATTVVSPITNTTYMASGTDSYNCVLSNMVAVTVNQKPNVIANTNKGSVCKGEGVTLTAGGATTYSWSNSLGTAASVNVTLPVETVYNYAVTGVDANGCTNTANVQVTANRCTGINEASKEGSSLSVYPNPAMSEVTVESGAGQLRSIEVIDLSGRTVLKLEAKTNSTKVDISNLSDGVYYFKVRSADAADLIKVVKGN